jgi:Ca2+-binding EF-hand superfamily protein
MLENKIYPTEDELYMVFRDFDKTKQGVITIDRFEEEMLPKENAQLLKDVLNRKFYPPSLRLEEDLEFQIAKYFQAKLDSYMTLNNIRIQLFKDGTFTTLKAFTLLYQNKKGVIETKEDIDAFLRSNGKLCKGDELRRIYEGLDFRREGPITFERFD